MNIPCHPVSRQRGATTLMVTAALCVVLMLAALYANRGLFLEQRLAARQQQSTLAFEAAEAGLEWAVALLDSPERIGADCLPAASASSAFRERYLDVVGTSAGFAPRTWNNAGTPTPLAPSCVRDAARWSCSCPASGPPTLVPPAGAALAPAFSLRFVAGSQPGLVRVVATGCTALAGACVPGATGRVDASTQVAVDLALLPALRQPPGAALTVRGAVNAATAALGAHNTDAASGGVAIQAGGAIDAPLAHLSAPAGQPSSSALRGGDGPLAALSADQLFVALFGMPMAQWPTLPGVKTVACNGSCETAIGAAIAAGHRLLWIDGDLDLQGPSTLGDAAQPVVLVARGAARLRGAVVLNGLLHAARIDWNEPAAGAAVHGALVSASDYAGNAAPELFRDGAVLARLSRHSGSFVRVPGSWRDF